MTLEQAREVLDALQKKLCAYDHALALMSYDGVTGAPKGTAANRAQSMGILSEERYRLQTGPAAAELLDLPEDVLLVVTADHSTACELKAHTADPVPILFCSPHVRRDEVVSFGERAFSKGGLGRMVGSDVMPEVMNILGRLHLIGA